MKKMSANDKRAYATDWSEAPIGAIVAESYVVRCNGKGAYAALVDSFSEAVHVAETMMSNEEVGVTVTIARVVDTVIRQFVIE
jgi:hypothetical protein